MTGMRCRWLSLVMPLIIPAFTSAGDVQVATDNGSAPERRSRVGSHVDIPLENARIKEFMMQLARSEQQARLTELMQKFLKDAILGKDPINAWKQSSELQKELQKFISPNSAAEGIDKELMRQLLEQFQGGNGPLPGTPAAPPSLATRSYLTRIETHSSRRSSKVSRNASRPCLRCRSRQGLPGVIEGRKAGAIASRTGCGCRGMVRGMAAQTSEEYRSQPRDVPIAGPQDMFREFNRFTKTDEWNRLPRSGRFNSLGKQIDEYVRRLNLDRLASHMRLPPLRNLSVSPSTNWRLPRVRIPSFNLTSPSAPNLGIPDSTATPSRGWITVSLVGVLIGLAWYLRRRYRGPASMQAALAAVPAVWPVAPESVSTKDELIRAFEYVSLVQLGLELESQHHPCLAEGLGGAEPAERGGSAARGPLRAGSLRAGTRAVARRSHRSCPKLALFWPGDSSHEPPVQRLFHWYLVGVALFCTTTRWRPSNLCRQIHGLAGRF